MSKMPRSQLARASVVGSTAMKMGVGKLKGKAKRPFLSEHNRQLEKEKRQHDEAELLFNAISQLRGTAVKLAQLLSMETNLLPKHVLDELSKSYHQVPPLNRVLVRKMITEELGDTPENLFSEFDLQAFAAASLGQVHRAKSAEEQVLAVKIQYPGIHLSIDSDLKLLNKMVHSGVKLLPKHHRPSTAVVEKSILEIGARLIDETDYQLEADNTRWFAKHLSIDGVQVPRVYEQFCSNRIITTEMLGGLHLDDWLAGNPSQVHRDRAAQLIYDLFFTSAIKLGRLHADPNPGNYLFKDNGEISLIDFGCVKQLSRRFSANLPALLHAFSVADLDRIVTAYADVGTTLRGDVHNRYESVLKPLGDWISKPITAPYFDFKENCDYTSSGLELIRDLSEMPGLETVDEDFIFFDRTLYGLFKIFERMQAKVYMRGHWELLWEKYSSNT